MARAPLGFRRAGREPKSTTAAAPAGPARINHQEPSKKKAIRPACWRLMSHLLVCTMSSHTRASPARVLGGGLGGAPRWGAQGECGLLTFARIVTVSTSAPECPGWALRPHACPRCDAPPVGSSYEHEGITGVSHALEHMIRGEAVLDYSH